VHSDVGNCCVAAKYNQELVPLRAEVHNGDHIEIITAPLAKPNPAWLNFVITGKARSHIRQYLKSIESEESSRLGEGMLNQALKALHINPSSIKESHWKKLIKDYGVKNKEDILAEIGLGRRMSVMVAHQLVSFMDGVSHEKGKHKQLDVITIKGSESMAIQLASCCHPIPGDPILGFINKDKGLVVHTHDCLAIRKFKLDPDKWLDVEWDPNPDRLFKVNLQIMVLNERGMLAKISSVIAESDSNIDNVNVEESDGGHFVNVNFIVQVHNRIHLADLMRNLRKITNISRISRVKMKTF
jgi:guanosine-3',5'-bis(diphosphate) 3'-pyrophosphohydrolase